MKRREFLRAMMIAPLVGLAVIPAARIIGVDLAPGKDQSVSRKITAEELGQFLGYDAKGIKADYFGWVKIHPATKEGYRLEYIHPDQVYKANV